jgi:hypothetical protein
MQTAPDATTPRINHDRIAEDITGLRADPVAISFQYVHHHQSLYDLAKQVGFCRQTLTRLAAEDGIVLREGPQDHKRKGVIDRDWLYEQYVDRGRALPDLPARRT